MTIEQQALQTAMQHHRSGRLAEAERIYRSILEQQPQQPDALHLLGVLANQSGRSEEAIDLIRRAIAARPEQMEFYSNLATILLSQQRSEEAIDALRKVVEMRPDSSEACNNYGVVLMNARRIDEALDAFRHSIAINPKNVEAQFNLGMTLGTAGKWDEAAAALRAVVALKPDDLGARETLGHALTCGWRSDEAVTVFREAIARFGATPELRTSLGNALFDAGLGQRAVEEVRRAVELRPADPKIHSNYLFLLQYQLNLDAQTILREHLRWDERHGQPLRGQRRPHQLDRNPDRRLKIGYVSADFREHAAARFLMPLFAHHNRDEGGFEITCYAEVPRPDAMTQRLRACIDRWRDTAGVSDADLAGMIRADRIDVIVDLTMHMARSRLPVYAREPAPVQVAWLAYPGTTGLSNMHYRLTDPYLDPPGTEAGRYSEETIRLPHTYWCYDPMSEEPVGDLPATAVGLVTFGCLNNFCKVNDPTISLWAKVLLEVSKSKMILMAPPGQPRQRVLDQLSRAGVKGERIEFVGFQSREQYLKTYSRIDICLDTIPYNGHTTSFDAFWMGAPVVTRVGQTLVGRAGLALLSNLGLAELAGQTDEEFVRAATKLANDLPRLAELRRGLRDRMQGSALMDGARFARDMESIYRDLWRRRLSQ